MNTTAMTKIDNKAMAYFRFRLSEMKVFFIISCVVTAAGFPLIAVMLARLTRFEFSDINANFLDFAAFILIVPLAVAGLIFMSYALAVSAFGHLHNRNISDMHFSLPVTHRQRFWSNFTAGLLCVIIPYVASFFAGVLIWNVFANPAGMQNILGEALTREISANISQYAFPLVLTGFVAIIMTYSFTVFCNTVCGNGFMAVFSPLLVSGVIPLLTLTLSVLAASNNGGEISGYPFVISTPLGFVIGSDFLIRQEQLFTVLTPAYIIPVSVIIGGLITSAFYLSKNVKAENVGRDFLYKSTYNVTQGLVCLCIVSLFGIFHVSANLIWLMIFAAIFSFVVYFIGHIVHYKGFHQLKSGALKYIAMLVGSAMVCSVLAMI